MALSRFLASPRFVHTTITHAGESEPRSLLDDVTLRSTLTPLFIRSVGVVHEVALGASAPPSSPCVRAEIACSLPGSLVMGSEVLVGAVRGCLTPILLST